MKCKVNQVFAVFGIGYIYDMYKYIVQYILQIGDSQH